MKLPAPLALDDLAVDLAGLLDGGEKLLRGLAQVFGGDFEGLVHAGELNAAEQFRMALDEGVDIGCLGRLADEVGDIDGEEVAGGEKAVDGGEGDVVGVADSRAASSRAP